MRHRVTTVVVGIHPKAIVHAYPLPQPPVSPFLQATIALTAGRGDTEYLYEYVHGAVGKQKRLSLLKKK